MTKGLICYQQSGCFHFIAFSYYHRLPYPDTAPARSLFEQSLKRMHVRFDFVVCGYVVMPEHVHLLVSEPQKVIPSGALRDGSIDPKSQNRDLGHPAIAGRRASGHCEVTSNER